MCIGISLCLRVIDFEHLSICNSYLKCLSRYFAHFYLYCLIEWQQFFLYSRYKFFVRYMNCKYFLPISGLPFCFLSNVFQRTKTFNFDEFQLDNFLKYLSIYLAVLSLGYNTWSLFFAAHGLICSMACGILVP